MSPHAGPVLAALLLVQHGAPVVVADPAQSLAVKIDAVQERAKLPATRRPPLRQMVVTQDEMNAWLRASAENRPKGVSEMTVRFEPQRLVARGMLDISDLKPKVALTPWNPLYWISGIVPVDVVGRVESANGRLTVDWEDVRIAAVPVSATMLRDLVLTATRGSKRYPGGLDITAPYDMPYEVRSIQLDTSRALVGF